MLASRTGKGSYTAPDISDARCLQRKSVDCSNQLLQRMADGQCADGSPRSRRSDLQDDNNISGNSNSTSELFTSSSEDDSELELVEVQLETGVLQREQGNVPGNRRSDRDRSRKCCACSLF